MREIKTITLREITYFWDILCYFPILLDFISSPSSYFKNTYKADVAVFLKDAQYVYTVKFVGETMPDSLSWFKIMRIFGEKIEWASI